VTASGATKKRAAMSAKQNRSARVKFQGIEARCIMGKEAAFNIFALLVGNDSHYARDCSA